MGRADFFDPGGHNAICDVCGFKYKAKHLKKRWDGFYVCSKDWEPRHPQDFIRGIKDDQHVPWTRPEATDVFIDETAYETIFERTLINSLGDDATFTRPSIGWSRDLSRFWSEKAVGLPRFHYGNSGEPTGVLIEAERENSLLQSRAFDTAWIDFIGLPPKAQNSVGIDGLQNSAWTIADTSNTLAESFLQEVAIADDSNTHCFSAYFKQDLDESRFPEWEILPVGSINANLSIQINTKTGEVAPRIEQGTNAYFTVADGKFWRLVLVLANNNTGSTSMRVRGWPAITDVFGGVDLAVLGEAVYDQAQLELNSDFPSSPIPTTTVAVTREKDTLSYPTADNMLANDTTLFMDWTPLAESMGTIFLFGSYVDADNYFAALHDGSNLILRKRALGVNEDAVMPLSYLQGTTYKLGFRLSATLGFDVWVNGGNGSLNTDSSGAKLGADFEIGSDGNGSNQAFSSIKNVKIYNVPLQDSDMKTLTI